MFVVDFVIRGRRKNWIVTCSRQRNIEKDCPYSLWNRGFCTVCDNDIICSAGLDTKSKSFIVNCKIVFNV